MARLGEQNINEQFQGWGSNLTDHGQERVFDTAAECLGDAVASIIALVDAESTADPTSG